MYILLNYCYLDQAAGDGFCLFVFFLRQTVGLLPEKQLLGVFQLPREGVRVMLEQQIPLWGSCDMFT